MGMITQRFCPECEGENVVQVDRESDLLMCESCGYSGAMNEQELIGRNRVSSVSKSAAKPKKTRAKKK